MSLDEQNVLGSRESILYALDTILHMWQEHDKSEDMTMPRDKQ